MREACLQDAEVDGGPLLHEALLRDPLGLAERGKQLEHRLRLLPPVAALYYLPRQPHHPCPAHAGINNAACDGLRRIMARLNGLKI